MDEQEGEHPDRLWGVADEPRPLAVQIWDNEPETLAKVGSRLAHEYRVSIVDINFGCPVKQVTEKAHSGSYLLRFPERMGAIIERVVKACAPTPVTAKIRLGCTRDKINAIDIAQVRTVAPHTNEVPLRRIQRAGQYHAEAGVARVGGIQVVGGEHFSRERIGGYARIGDKQWDLP